MSFNNQIVAGLPLEFVSIATGGTYTVENHGQKFFIGASGGTLTMSVILTEGGDFFEDETTIASGKYKYISEYPKGAIVKFTGATAKIGLWT